MAEPATLPSRTFGRNRGRGTILSEDLLMTMFIDPRFDPDPRDRSHPHPQDHRRPGRSGRAPPPVPGEIGSTTSSAGSGPESPCRWPRTPRPAKWAPSALEIALEDGDHALTLLLLCNGYDPNCEQPLPAGPGPQRSRGGTFSTCSWTGAPIPSCWTRRCPRYLPVGPL